MIIDSSAIKEGNPKLAEQLISSIEPTIIIRQDTSLEAINLSFEQLTGFPSKGLLGSKAPYPWWTEETLIKNSNTLAKIIGGDTGSYFELYQKKSGEQFCAEVDSQIIELKGDKDKHYLIRLVDTVKFTSTDRIHIGLELYTHKLIQNASYPILVTNPDGSIKCVNYALEEMTGYRANELVGQKPPYSWCTSDEKSEDYDLLNVNTHTRRRGVWRIEKLLHNKFGKLYWIEITGIPVFRSGKIQYYVCNWRDITEQKLLEQKITDRSSNMDNPSAHIDYILKKGRKKISREPHDEIEHSLSFIKMKPTSFKDSLLPDHDNVPKQAASMYKLVCSTLEKVEKLYAESGPQVHPEREILNLVKSLALQLQKLSGANDEIAVDQNKTAVNYGVSEVIDCSFDETLSTNESDMQKQNHENLSPREFQIMCMIARGMRLKDIAERLYLSVKTVSTYRANILSKMDYTTNAELTHYAISNRLVEW
ncbi:PAS domain S-box protein [Chloroflexota bacterium]